MSKNRIELEINGSRAAVNVDGSMPLLWVLRDELGLTGSKYGCGQGMCGACTVLVDGAARRACITPVASVANRSVTTVEGLGSRPAGRKLQEAWTQECVAQCGYCQAGQLMSAAALLERNPRPDDSAIDTAMAGNLCRCGTYGRIRKAILRAARP